MPVLDEATYNGRRARSASAAVSTSLEFASNLSNGVIARTDVAPLVDLLDMGADEPVPPCSSGGNFLLDLIDVDMPSSSSQSVSGTTQPQKSGTDVLLDLLSAWSPPPQKGSPTTDIILLNQDDKPSVNALDILSSSMVPSGEAKPTGPYMMDLLDVFGPNPATPEESGPTFPPIVAYESSALTIIFNFSKRPENPQMTDIEAMFTNKSSDVYTDFVFQAAVPKFLQLHLEPASSNTLPASGNGSITQKLHVTNRQHGKKSLVMRIRLSYKLNNKAVLEEGQISNFPRDL